MTAQEIAKINFMDGVAVEDVVRIFTACDLQSGNFNLTRLFYLRQNGEWGFFDVETVVVSVCIVAKPRRTYFAMGQDGIIWGVESGGGNPFIEKIVGAGTGRGKYGYLSQIRVIDGILWICGDQGQVYRRINKGWQHNDQGLLHKERKKNGVSLNSIDGRSQNDVYVVGDSGKMFHFNGTNWAEVQLNTNLHLNRVKCVSSGEIYIGGENGVFIRGNGNTWEVLSEDEMEGNIWDIEMFRDKIYLAVEDKLMVYDGTSTIPVNTGLRPEVDAHRLSAANGYLWSFGEKDLAAYDGQTWTRVTHPDNE